MASKKNGSKKLSLADLASLAVAEVSAEKNVVVDAKPIFPDLSQYFGLENYGCDGAGQVVEPGSTTHGYKYSDQAYTYFESYSDHIIISGGSRKYYTYQEFQDKYPGYYLSSNKYWVIKSQGNVVDRPIEELIKSDLNGVVRTYRLKGWRREYFSYHTLLVPFGSDGQKSKVAVFATRREADEEVQKLSKVLHEQYFDEVYTKGNHKHSGGVSYGFSDSHEDGFMYS
jgi:predicted DNA-binding protein (MmcQ/YjbR family)